MHRGNHPGPDAVNEALNAARSRLDAAAAAKALPERRPRSRTGLSFRQRLRRPGLITAVVVAGGLVASGIGITHWTAPESAAASTLHDAARAAASQQESLGAYTKVTETEQALVYASSDGKHYDEGYLAPVTSTTWVPTDVSGTWVRETWSGPATTFYGGDAVRKAAADAYATEAHRDDPIREQAAAGDFAAGELGGEQPGQLTAADIAGLPRDRDALIRRIEAAPRAADTTNAEHIFDTIRQLLRTGLVPAELRATMFDALATLPDVVITEEQASLDGRTGTAIGLPTQNGAERRDIIIDRSNGTYLGERTVQTRNSGNIPEGAIIDSVSIQVAVVNDQP